jgi:hypothetical protein
MLDDCLQDQSLDPLQCMAQVPHQAIWLFWMGDKDTHRITDLSAVPRQRINNRLSNSLDLFPQVANERMCNEKFRRWNPQYPGNSGVIGVGAKGRTVKYRNQAFLNLVYVSVAMLGQIRTDVCFVSQVLVNHRGSPA